MKRVTAISPYSEAVDAAEHCFFAESGIETIAGAHLDITDGFRLTEPGARVDVRLALGSRSQKGS
jgi:maleate cis-trans isomerase